MESLFIHHSKVISQMKKAANWKVFWKLDVSKYVKFLKITSEEIILQCSFRLYASNFTENDSFTGMYYHYWPHIYLNLFCSLSNSRQYLANADVIADEKSEMIESHWYFFADVIFPAASKA